MVSTRSVKYKFSEGEKVLCYEPDPAKTKVLYNSKVLDICSKKDETGKKVVQFLIHFQGWNSTWDRFVTEEYVLKDTEENRQLQKELAESASLTAGGNLYKRDRKKRAHKLTDRGEGGEAKRGPSSSLVAPPPQSSDSDHDESLPLALSNSLKSILELDFQLVTHQNKVLNLPAEPNAVKILDSFLKDYATSEMLSLVYNRKSHSRNPGSSDSPNVMTLEGFCRKVNLCREVVDGLRVYMDFMLEKVLLYKQERGQHQQAMTTGIQLPYAYVPKIKTEEGSPKKSVLNVTIKEESNVDSDDAMVVEIDRRRSLRSHTNTSTDTNLQNGGRVSNKTSGIGELAAVSKPENKYSMLGRLMTKSESEVMKRIMGWDLLPYSEWASLPPHPSLVYGATHLARLFVKLPELLQRSDHSEAQTNVLIDHLCNFMKYLEDHPEWFGEEHYRDNNYTPPPTPEPVSSASAE